MEPIVHVVLGGATFLSFVADFEPRDDPPAGRRVWGWTAGALFVAMAPLICRLISASEA